MVTESREFFIVDKRILPNSIQNVIKVNEIVQKEGVSKYEAIRRVGISRSTYYKYKDFIKPFFESGKDTVFNINMALHDEPGMLSKIFNVINTGTAPLVVSNISLDNSAFTISTTSFTLDNTNDNQSVEVIFDPDVRGLYEGVVTITSNASNTPGINTNGNGIAPTYTADIAPIMSSRCTNCHGSTPSNGAPMSLTTLANVKDAVENRGLLGRVENGTMPPSGSDLTAAQIQAIKDWQSNGFQ